MKTMNQSKGDGVLLEGNTTAPPSISPKEKIRTYLSFEDQETEGILSEYIVQLRPNKNKH
jgi:hypothetical protein